MNIYTSKSSGYVKFATISVLIVLTIIVVTLITLDKNYGLIGGIILSTIILATVIYCYANSLNEIILERDQLVLKKNAGQIQIPKSDIVRVQQMGYSNLTMTYGSQGIFGYIGSTMDNATSFVKDRNAMVQITTKDKRYIVSSEQPGELVKNMKSLYNLVG